MKPDPARRQLTRGEQEAETEARRLNELIDDALAMVAVGPSTDLDSLEAITDRIERAARDLSVALRELARERRIAQNSAE
jgi:hypothetical protein